MTDCKHFGKMKIWLILVVVVSLVGTCSADSSSTNVVVSSINPAIDSVTTYRDYINDSLNNQTSSFSAYNNTRNVYVQVKASDLNGYQDIESVKVRIVLWDGSTESNFARFGTSYVNATFESGNSNQAIYYYNFTMIENDQSRLGIESPPLYYRAKAQVDDGQVVVTSNTSDAENGDYTYEGYLPSFDIDVNIPSQYGTVDPGDSVSADINITKFTPTGVKNINITYELINPSSVVVDSSSESTSITNTLNRTQTLSVSSGATGGSYVFRVTVSYPEGITSSQDSFNVRTPEEEEEEEEEEDEGGGQHWITVDYGNFTITIKEVKIDVLDSFNVSPGEVTMLAVTITNIGYVDLMDVSISLDGVITPSRIAPESIQKIVVGDKWLSTITLRLPEELAGGSYTLTLGVFSEGVELGKKEIIMNVLEKEEKPVAVAEEEILRSELENLKKVHFDIQTHALEIGSKGIDIGEVILILGEAESSILRAENALDGGNLIQTRKLLDKARSLLEQASIKLARLSVVGEAGFPQEIFWVMGILIIVGILFFIYKRRSSSSYSIQ